MREHLNLNGFGAKLHSVMQLRNTLWCLELPCRGLLERKQIVGAKSSVRCNTPSRHED